MRRTMLALLLSACGAEEAMPTGPGFQPPSFEGPSFEGSSFRLTVIGTAADGLMAPTGLAFATGHPDRLWVVDRATNGVVIFFEPGGPNQRAEARVDRYAEHFMVAVSGIAFSNLNEFATCQDSLNVWNLRPVPPDDFMGPTLWSGDLEIFARVGQKYPKVDGLEGSHLDMLHESPLCTGIAHERHNVFWVFDGRHGHIVRYDFGKNHGPGGSVHNDGRVERYPEATVTRVAERPSQLAFDDARRYLYVADTGADRIMRLDTSVTGSISWAKEPPPQEALAEYAQVTGVPWEQVASVPSPVGLVFHRDRLFVASRPSGDILILDLDGNERGRIATGAPGIGGMAMAPDGLYFVDQIAHSVTRVAP